MFRSWVATASLGGTRGGSAVPRLRKDVRKAPREERRAYWKDLKECIQSKQFPSEWKDVLALLVMKPGEDPRELPAGQRERCLRRRACDPTAVQL